MFAWLALLWRRGPAAFAHALGRAPIVEVLLPVLFAWFIEFTSSAFVLMSALPLQAPTEVEGQALQPNPWKGRLKGRE